MALRDIYVEDFPWQGHAPVRPDEFPPKAKLVFRFESVDPKVPRGPVVYEFSLDTPTIAANDALAVKIELEPDEILGDFGLEHEPVPPAIVSRFMCNADSRVKRFLTEIGVIAPRIQLDCWRPAPVLYLTHSRATVDSLFLDLPYQLPEIGAMTPDEAARHLREKAAGVRQRLSVLGQSVDERIVYYVGPLVILAILWVLLADLLALRRAIGLLRDMKVDAPAAHELMPSWIGMHSNALAQAFAFLTILVLPVSALLAAWLQAGEEFGLAQDLSVFVLLSVAAIACLSLRVIGRVRREIGALSVQARLRARAARRAAVWMKRAERRASHSAVSHDEDPC